MIDSTKAVLDFSPPLAAWVNEQTEISDEVESRIEQIKLRGFTVFEDCYEEEELATIRTKVDVIYKTQIEEVGGDEQYLYDIGDGGVVRQLLAYDETFLKYAIDERVISLVKRLLGEHFILYQQNANIHQPNIAHCSAPWHRDLTFWHYTSSKPLAITALHIIDDYTEDSGGLSILPGTHKQEKFPSNDYVTENKQFVTPKAGTIIVFDSMMFHSPQVNPSNAVRRSIPHFYTLHLIAQQISLPKLLNGKWSDDDSLRGFLGYNSIIQGSVKAWREEKFANKRKSLLVY